MNFRIGVAVLFAIAFALPVLSQERGDEVLAKSAACVFTVQDFRDVLTMDSAVLQTPLSPAEEERGRQRMLAQFKKNPEVFCKNLPLTRQAAETMRHGSRVDREKLGVDLWTRWLLAAPYDPLAAEWVAVVKQHNPPVVTADGLSVSRRQLDAMFASNDWVARAANLATSTTESRAPVEKELPSKFASLPQLQKERLALADQRWAALQDVILGDENVRAKTVAVVKEKVHTAADVAAAARVLEDISVQYQSVMRENAQRTIAVLGALGQAYQARNLGEFNAHAPH